MRTAAERGARWLALSTVLLTVFSFAQNIAISRLLDRREVGLVGMLWAALGLAQVFHDMGLGSAVVQRRDVTHKEISTVFWLSAIAGFVLWLLIFASAPLVAAYYREPSLLFLAPWVGAAFFFQSLGQPFYAVAQRELRFGLLASTDLASAAAALVVSVAMAWNGAGAKAMLSGSVAAAATRCGLLSILQRKSFWPSLYCRPKQIVSLLHFGAYQMADKCLNYLGSNLDYILIGRVWGADPLAVYRTAYETALRPLAIINPVFNSVAYPIFARKQEDDEALRQGLAQGLRFVSGLAFPLLAGLAVTADWAVLLLYGPKWAGAASILSILCLTGALRCVVNLAGSVLLAKGRARRAFWLTVFNLALLAPAYAVAVGYGTHAMAWASAGVLLFIACSTYGWIYTSMIQMPIGLYLRSLRGAGLSALGMAGGVLALRWSGVMESWHWGIQFAISVLAGAVLYVALSWLLQRELFGRLRSVIWKR